MLANSSPTKDASDLVARLRALVGQRQVLLGRQSAARPFLTAYRSGGGDALAVVRPTTLVLLWRVLNACVEADAIVILQAANTGLTGGSTPAASGYDRPVVVISTRALTGIHLIDGGQQVVCLPGATLDRLETALAPLDREPHSVIGSSCIGASVIGGICNNSGGALVRRGPAYTELALYAQVDAQRRVTLVNDLGIDLPGDAEAALAIVERGDFVSRVRHDRKRHASSAHYESRVRAVESDRPARYNADPAGLHQASGCAGKLCVFAVRLDSFPRDRVTRTFYIGTNDPDELTRLRHRMLSGNHPLPVAAEYLSRDAFDVAATYGKDMFLAIERMGTSRLPLLARIAARVDAIAAKVGAGANASDRLLHRVARLMPDHLPSRMLSFRERFAHHLILKVADAGIASTEALLTELFPSASGAAFACTEDEARKAFLHRFVTAGAAVRYRTLHPTEVEDVLAFDVALARNACDWSDQVPPDIASKICCLLAYGHFFCHVFHLDYVLRKGTDIVAAKSRLSDMFDSRGAEYPAEHNCGHSYAAKPALRDFHRSLDPTNSLNPGVGLTSMRRNWTATTPEKPGDSGDRNTCYAPPKSSMSAGSGRQGMK